MKGIMEIDRIYKELGSRLQAHRKAANLTQAVVAEGVGLNRTSISNIEKGRQRIPLHMLFAFSKVLGIPAVKLLPDEDILTEEEVVDKTLLERASLDKKGREWVKRVVSSS